jgi:hypothetical protein
VAGTPSSPKAFSYSLPAKYGREVTTKGDGRVGHLVHATSITDNQLVESPVRCNLYVRREVGRGEPTVGATGVVALPLRHAKVKSQRVVYEVAVLAST